jgi:prevent-host-death family protein
MAKTIAQRDLRNDNATIIDAVAKGETFIVTRHGAPVAELRPIAARVRTFVSRADVATLAAASPRVDAARFRADVDRALEQSV